MLRSRQKINGPLHAISHLHRNIKDKIPRFPKRVQNIPQIPISQPFAHTPLQNNIGIRPSPDQIAPTATTATKPRSLAPFRSADPSAAALQKPAQQVFGPQHLAHLLPHGAQVSR